MEEKNCFFPDFDMFWQQCVQLDDCVQKLAKDIFNTTKEIANLRIFSRFTQNNNTKTSEQQDEVEQQHA